MVDITLTDLTDATTGDNGTGVFDILMQTVELHIEEQFTKGRIHGKDYATVYLGAMQTVMSQSIQYLLNEQEAGKRADLIDSQIASETKRNEPGGIIDKEIEKIQQEIDLVIAKTAESYESIAASQANTTRENQLNQKQLLKVNNETELVYSQNLEVIRNTLRKDELQVEQILQIREDVLKTTDEIILIQQQRIKVDEETDLLQSRDLEQIDATTRQNNESAEKVNLLIAQTTGFKTNAKQQLLKIMNDTFAANLSIGGVATIPDASKDIAIDAVANDILDDLGSAVGI